jgi:hypothetical protein
MALVDKSGTSIDNKIDHGSEQSEAQITGYDTNNLRPRLKVGSTSTQVPNTVDEFALHNEKSIRALDVPNLVLFVSPKPSEPAIDPQAESILRSHYANLILADLKRIQPHAQTELAAIYAEKILRNMRSMRDASTHDPYLEVVMALYDAMVYEDRWADYASVNYEQAYSILKILATETNITREKVEKAIIKLEDAGFDTTPFCGITDFDEEMLAG